MSVMYSGNYDKTNKVSFIKGLFVSISVMVLLLLIFAVIVNFNPEMIGFIIFHCLIGTIINTIISYGTKMSNVQLVLTALVIILLSIFIGLIRMPEKY